MPQRHAVRCCGLQTLRTVVAAIVVGGVIHAADEAQPVTLVADGVARVPIVVGSVREPAAELQRYLQQMSGAAFDVVPAEKGKTGIHVGLATDFPWLELPETEKLGTEGFLIKTAGQNVLLIGHRPLGVQHAVTTFLHRFGCRWFFPGETWEVVPRQKAIRGVWNERQSPSFPTQRRIWYGFGAYPKSRDDWEAWVRHNRMGGPIEVSIGHSWHGLNAERDFARHPEWFALVDGKRQPSKPCYSHPEVIEIATQAALRQAAADAPMISMTPPDGLGYCECERCLAVFQGEEPFGAHSTLFAKRQDGALVNVTSETLFACVNKVAEAVAKDYPETLIGCYAYSAYSHPPSFKLHPNVYLQTTTAYRRTPLSLEEQISQFGEKSTQVGIREYYSVYQWDWDWPDPGKMAPRQLQQDLRFFHKCGVTAVNAEASNNWAARGLGYYLAARLLWEVDAEMQPIVRDFYERAFGPAAPAVERYFVRWYGPEVAVLGQAEKLPEQVALYEKGKLNLDALRAAFQDLDEAARLVADVAGCRERVDHLRMYLHYLVLRHRLLEAERSGDKQGILDAIRDETVFGGRLTDTNMLHSRPLIGKAFLRRFRKHAESLAEVPAAAKSGAGWRTVGQPPSREELARLWAEDKRELGIE